MKISDVQLKKKKKSPTFINPKRCCSGRCKNEEREKKGFFLEFQEVQSWALQTRLGEGSADVSHFPGSTAEFGGPRHRSQAQNKYPGCLEKAQGEEVFLTV